MKTPDQITDMQLDKRIRFYRMVEAFDIVMFNNQYRKKLDKYRRELVARNMRQITPEMRLETETGNLERVINQIANLWRKVLYLDMDDDLIEKHITKAERKKYKRNIHFRSREAGSKKYEINPWVRDRLLPKAEQRYKSFIIKQINELGEFLDDETKKSG